MQESQWSQLLIMYTFDCDDCSRSGNQVFQHNILFRIDRLLFRSLPNSSEIHWFRFRDNFRSIGHNNSAILHKLHEDSLLTKKLFVLFGSLWHNCLHNQLLHALHRGNWHAGSNRLRERSPWNDLTLLISVFNYFFYFTSLLSILTSS